MRRPADPSTFLGSGLHRLGFDLSGASSSPMTSWRDAARSSTRPSLHGLPSAPSTVVITPDHHRRPVVREYDPSHHREPALVVMPSTCTGCRCIAPSGCSVAARPPRLRPWSPRSRLPRQQRAIIILSKLVGSLYSHRVRDATAVPDAPAAIAGGCQSDGSPTSASSPV